MSRVSCRKVVKKKDPVRNSPKREYLPGHESLSSPRLPPPRSTPIAPVITSRHRFEQSAQAASSTQQLLNLLRKRIIAASLLIAVLIEPRRKFFRVVRVSIVWWRRATIRTRVALSFLALALTSPTLAIAAVGPFGIVSTGIAALRVVFATVCFR